VLSGVLKNHEVNQNLQKINHV